MVATYSQVAQWKKKKVLCTVFVTSLKFVIVSKFKRQTDRQRWRKPRAEVEGRAEGGGARNPAVPPGG